jgi:hypothetical protein
VLGLHPAGEEVQQLLKFHGVSQVQPQTFFLNSQHEIVYQVFGVVTQAELSKGTSLMQG